MPTFYDQLKEAHIEHRTSDPSTLGTSRIWFRTDTKQLKVYDGVNTRIIPFGSAGGGGNGLIWQPDESGNSATEALENNQKLWWFASGLSQKIHAILRVPSSYVAGDPINVLIKFYSPSSSGTALLQCLATLIRAGTDAIGSTTNQRTTTNTAVTLTAGDIVQAATLDVTSSTGTINSVAVSPGDVIKLRLTRGTDTSLADIRFIESCTEVTFS